VKGLAILRRLQVLSLLLSRHMGGLQTQPRADRSADRSEDYSAARILVLTVFMCFLAAACHAQDAPVVCRDGNGSFEAAFGTGVSVQAAAARRDGFATHSCEGALLWDKGRLVVATAVSEVDIDGFGIDLGLGSPVTTLQVKKSAADCCMTLQIYSLRKPPKLFRSIIGGSFFRTADTDLDGQIEIWTSDAASLDGFEPGDIAWSAVAPTLVLRFVRGRLLDVSSEFRRYFDSQIARLQGELNSEDLRDFKSSNGRLPVTAYFSPDDVRRGERLARIKQRVVQMVWAYLYSGREEQAWAALDQMWPPADRDRIRAAIVSARARGIRVQIDATSATSSSGAERLAEIADLRTLRTAPPEMKIAGQVPEQKTLRVARPLPIWIGRRIPQGQPEPALADSGVLVDLVIDAAGKVRSAESDNPAFDQSFKNSTAQWKFIPAFREGRAVASRIYLIVEPKR
jgi:hypothetical protein